MTLNIEHLTEIGFNKAKKHYMVDVNGTDHTHFTETEANQIAKIIAQHVQSTLNE